MPDLELTHMLTQKGKYAIKALVLLAEKGGLVRTQVIADEAHIPKKFLESILIELKNHGLVSSKQGAAGGTFSYATHPKYPWRNCIKCLKALLRFSNVQP